MPFLVLLVLAFAPGVFWLWFFVRKDVYRPEPRRLLIATFALGAAVTIPVALVEVVFLGESMLSDEVTLGPLAVAMLLVVGPAEELGKFAVVRFVPYRSLYFDEPMDGLVYGAAASLGFASLENLAYMVALGPAVILARGPISTLGHLVLSSIWAYPLGLRSQSKSGMGLPVAAGLAIAAMAHGIFNIMVFSAPLVALAMVALGAVWTMSRFNWAQRVSPFRYRRNYPLVRCEVCQRQVRVTSLYCRFCGSPAEARPEALYCGNCKGRNRPDASYCTACGDKLLIR
ncbi:MAG: PrsW family glutamic-type intramembrane protease [Chloroflexi bacterium]|nr:PrsW family glutamic-type intramembrane protease [Chloroflexota bacterium]